MGERDEWRCFAARVDVQGRGPRGGARLAVRLALCAALSGACAHEPPKKEPVVNSLTFEGNHALSDRAIDKKILTAKTGWWPFAAKRYFDPVAWSTDLERVKRLYRSHGYYQAEIVHDQVTPRPPSGVDLSVEVREDEPTRISSLDVTGLEALPPEARAKLLKTLSLQTSAVFAGVRAGPRASSRSRRRCATVATPRSP